VLIETIEVAADGVANATSTDDVADEHIREHALKRMAKSLTLTLAIIKGVGADLYSQWNPSPTIPMIEEDFDPTDDAQLENYMSRVNDFLNGIVSDLDVTQNPEEASTMIYKLGKGIKKISLHIAPFAKLLIKLGNDSGLVNLPSSSKSLTAQVPAPYGIICNGLDLLFQVCFRQKLHLNGLGSHAGFRSPEGI